MIQPYLFSLYRKQQKKLLSTVEIKIKMEPKRLGTMKSTEVAEKMNDLGVTFRSVEVREDKSSR
jgi:hypothetical protein